MTVRCDLHAIRREMHVEVRVCRGVGVRDVAQGRRNVMEPFVVVELRVGGGWVTMFLEPDQALEIAQSITRFIKPLDEDGVGDAEVVPEKEVS